MTKNDTIVPDEEAEEYLAELEESLREQEALKEAEIFLDEDRFHADANTLGETLRRYSGLPVIYRFPTAKKKSPPLLPKPRVFINATPFEKSLTLSAHRLLNTLLAISMNYLTDHKKTIMFSAYASDIRQAIGQASSKGNSQLDEALNQLRKKRLVYPWLGGTVMPFLTEARLSENGEKVFWRIHPVLCLIIALSEQPYGWVDLREAAGLTSTFALRLYEYACLRINLKFPNKTYSLDELRALFQVEGRRYDWYGLRTRVLEPAMKQINEKTELGVEIKTKNSPRRNAVVGAQIIVYRSPPEKKEEEAESEAA